MARTRLRFAIFAGLMTIGLSSFAETSIMNRMSNEENRRVFDVIIDSGVRENIVRDAFEFFEEHHETFANDDYMTLVDMTLPSTEKRLYLVDLHSGGVEKYLVAHGRGSGKIIATDFSNQPSSNKTSLGFYLVNQEIKSPKHGRALELIGLSKSDSNAKARAIHGGRNSSGVDYVSEKFIQMRGYLGRSEGCPAIEQKFVPKVFPKITNKSLLYIYGVDQKLGN